MFSSTIGLNLKDSEECTLVLTVQLFCGCGLALVIPISPSPRCCPRTARSSSVLWSTSRTHTEPHTPCMSWRSWKRKSDSSPPPYTTDSSSSTALAPPTSVVVLSHRWVCVVGGWGWMAVCCIYVRSWFN